jgi:hypothetical protein
MNGRCEEQDEWHSIRLRVLGLTGIAADATIPTTGISREPTRAPKHMRAVVAVTRDAARYGFSGPSLRLVKVPKHEHFVAIWGNTSSLQQQYCNKKDTADVIEFETAIELRLWRSLHRNFELVIGVTSSSRRQPTPIGAASLPLQQAMALRSRETGKIVLDLPVFNLASLKDDPFTAAVGSTNNEYADTSTDESSSKKERIGALFRSRSMRRQRTGTTASGTSTSSAATTIAPLRPSPRDAVPNQCPFRMDPARDAAILRIELEIVASPTNVVLVQPQDDAIETAHSLDRKGRAMQLQGGGGRGNNNGPLSSSFSKKQYRVKVVDQTTMECEIAPVLGCRFAAEEDDEPPNLASSSGDLSSVVENNHLHISPRAVESVLSDGEARYDISVIVDDMSNNQGATDGTSLAKFGVEATIGADVEKTVKTVRRPSFAFPLLRSLSFSSASRSPSRRPAGGNHTEPERFPSPLSEVSGAPKPLPAMRIVGAAIHGETSSQISQEVASSKPTIRCISPSSGLPVVFDNNHTAAPETFEPMSVHFSPTKPADSIQFALAMNMINVPPPARKKPEIDEWIPMGTVLQAPADDETNLESPVVRETGLISTIQRGLTKHWREMFTVAEEEETYERSTSPEEEETMETDFQPAFREDIVDLVAAFGDMCRPVNANALDESLTEGPAWVDDDDQEDDDEDDQEDDPSEEDVDDDTSNFSELFGDVHRVKGSDIDPSIAPTLRQSYLLPIRSKKSFLNFRRGNNANETGQHTFQQPTSLTLNTRQQMMITASSSNQQLQVPSTPPKQLKSLLRNGHVSSPIRAVPEEEEESFGDDDPNEGGSPNCVSQPPNATAPTTTGPWKPQHLLPAVSSMAQNLVDYVAKAISPVPPPPPPEAPVPVPAVFLQSYGGGRDAVSVGDLTATSHEIQVDMENFRKLIQEHLDRAARDKKEYLSGTENMFEFTDNDDDDDDDEQTDYHAVDSNDQQDDVGSNSSDWEA